MKKLSLFFIATLLSVSMFAGDPVDVTVYYAIPSSVVGSYTVKLNVNHKGDGDEWQQFTMTKTSRLYQDSLVYKCTYTAKYGGAGKLQFQLYNGESYVSQQQPISSWTDASDFNNKMYVYDIDGWNAIDSYGYPVIKFAKKTGDASHEEIIPTEGSAYASYNVDLSVGQWYNLWVISDGSWFTKEDQEFTRTNRSYKIPHAENKRSMYFQADRTGTYRFQWQFSDSTLTIYYPGEAPANVTIYFVNTKGWADANVYAHPFTGDYGYRTWPGMQMTNTGNQVQGYDIFSVTFPETYTSIEFSNNGDDATKMRAGAWTASQYYCWYEWYANTSIIPAEYIRIKGAWDGWVEHSLLNNTGDWTASKTFTLDEGSYEFGFMHNEAWKANGATITRENNTTDFESGSGNMTLTADYDGDYTFVWAYLNDELEVIFPSLLWKKLNVGDVIKVGERVNVIKGDTISWSFKETAESATSYSYNSSKAPATLLRANIEGSIVTEDENGDYYVFKDATGAYTFKEDGHRLTVTTKSDGIEIKSKEIATSGDNKYMTYVLGVHDSGSATAIDNTDAATKAVKRIVNGQLVIEREGKLFNALGAEVK